MPTWTGWPPKSRLSFWSRERPLPLRYDEAGNINISDTVMLFWHRAQRTVEMRLSSLSRRWDRWDEGALAMMEENIRYDLGDDGFRVTIKRLSGMGEPCSTEMRWKLIVR